MNKTQSRHDLSMFHENELVTWHYHNGGQSIPVPGVVVRLEPDNVVIRTRIQGVIREMHVDPDQLAAR